jgi:peptidyl-prolyl cis-trans isomerase B (cyclophilin B)
VIRARLPLLALVPLLFLTGACGEGEKATEAKSKGPCEYVSDGATAARKVKKPPATPPKDLPATLTIVTNDGDIPVTLDTEQAPCAVNSLVSLAKQGYFDRTPCHRLSTQGYFVLQCGDPTGTGRGGPGYTFADELVDNDPRLQPCGSEGGQEFCTYNAGTVAMANAGPDTNGSQFFLVYGNSKFPPDYTVVGHMDAAGLKVVKGIAAKGIAVQGLGPGDGTPKEPVRITDVK